MNSDSSLYFLTAFAINMASDSDSIRVNKRSRKTYDDLDLISNLPEFVISHILSFLPTKEVVRTCVLSTRWTYIWTSIIELHFDDTDLYSSSSKKKSITKSSFVNSIYRVLLHLKSMSLHSFKLYISEIYDPYHINQWISALSIRKVKKIYFQNKGRKIPSDIFFKCHSLEELHLKGCGIQIPNPVSLSSLRVLTLGKIEITSNPSNKLTLNLPSLKEYVQENCNWNGVNSVSFEVPLLEVLQISNICYSLPEIVFSAVSLTRLCYSGYGLTQNIHLLADHVASAEIRLDDSKLAGVQGMRNFVFKLLTTNVQRLKLCMNKPEVFAEMKYPFVDIHSFGRLTHLELDGCPTNLLLDFLLKTPCLQTLILRRLYYVEEQLNFEIVPDCLYTLKVVKFEMFCGKEDGLNIAKFLVENAKVLEQISFSYNCDVKWKKKKLKKDKEKLFSFKRGKSLALIEFKC